MMAQGPDPALPKDGKPRPMGSRRIFPPLFKLQVLDSYRHDHDCKGNQRATARKFNIHRRQIQKWLQCEEGLRSVVAESMRQEGENGLRHSGPGDTSATSERRAPRVFKHDARTLKLVAQKLYPSSYGAMLKDSVPGPIDAKGELRKTTPEYFVPKEYQLNDTRSEASGVRSEEEGGACRKPSIDGSTQDLNLKDAVSGLKLCGSQPESNSLIQKYSRGPGPELSSHMEPRSLGVAPPPPIMYHPPMFMPSHPLPPLHLRHRYSPPPPRMSPVSYLLPSAKVSPQPYPPLLAPVAYSTEPAEEPCNLVKPSSQPEEPPYLPVAMPSETHSDSRGGSPTTEEVKPAKSPPSRATELVAESKTSAFSPKRKWLQDSLQEKLVAEPEPVLPPKQRMKMSPPIEEPKPKRPCPDFSIERLCGSPAATIKSEASSPPSQPTSPTLYPTSYRPPVVFPPLPPPLLPHRSIPEMLSLHFRPEVRCPLSPIPVVKHEPFMDHSPDPSVKEESLSEDEETIDILSTTPVENKTFDFNGLPGGKRRSFSVQFKLSVLDAFYHDKDCNRNQRATARKFNINRRQVQKWLSLEPELRIEGCRKKPDGPVGVSEFCAQCPQHCGAHHGLEVSVKHCAEQSCFLSDLKHEGARTVPFLHGNLVGWPHPSALRMPGLHYMPWYNQYDYTKIY